MASLNRRYVRPNAPAAASAPAAEPFRLTFLLPRMLTLGLETGVHHPCLFRCLLRIERHRERDYLVRIQAPSRELAFDQARRYLRLAAKGHIARGAALQIAAVLVTPRGGRDTWTIIVGADVAFSPTGLDADLPTQPVHISSEVIPLRGELG